MIDKVAKNAFLLFKIFQKKNSIVNETITECSTLIRLSHDSTIRVGEMDNAINPRRCRLVLFKRKKIKCTNQLFLCEITRLKLFLLSMYRSIQ